MVAATRSTKFFVRFLRRDVLSGVARAHRHPGKLQPCQKFTHRPLVHLNAEAPRDLITQVAAPPAHRLVLFQRRTRPHPVSDRCLLLFGQFALRPAGVRVVPQAIQPTCVVPMHPIAKRLPIHPRRAGRFRPRGSVQHQGKRQHAPRRRHILGASRRHPQASSVKIRPRDRNRHVQSSGT